jgi:DNA-binding NtrC family response regulator
MPEPLRAGTPEHRQLPVGSPGVAANEIVPWLVGATVEEIERKLILQTVAYYLGNRTRAAGVLGISIRTLRNKIKEYVAQGLAVTEPSQLRSARTCRRNRAHPPC